MKKQLLLIVILAAIPVFVQAGTVLVDKDWFNYNFQPDGAHYMITATFQATVPSTMSPGQLGTVTGIASKTGAGPGVGSLNPKGGHECPLGGCQNFPGTFLFTSGDYGPGATTRTFTAPSTPGTYQMGFFAYFDTDPIAVGWCYGGSQPCITPFSYGATAVIVVQGSQCSDSIDNEDNDNPSVSDMNDPECHTDCNANNPSSYVPSHNSESTPPNGSCPAAPTLQLNGRPAPIPPGAFNFIKNFFTLITAKAFAGE